MTDPVGYLDMGQAVLQVETSSAQILLLISASNKNHSLVNQADFTQKIRFDANQYWSFMLNTQASSSTNIPTSAS